MDINQLRNFVLVAKQCNISAVARQVNLSQPSLSRQMKVIEKQVGAQLFIRKSKSIAPTPAGILLQEEAEKLLDQADLLFERVRLVGNTP